MNKLWSKGGKNGENGILTDQYDYFVNALVGVLQNIPEGQDLHTSAFINALALVVAATIQSLFQGEEDRIGKQVEFLEIWKCGSGKWWQSFWNTAANKEETMFKPLVLGSLALLAMSVNANAHMGRYPCDFDEAFVAKIRKLSKDERPQNFQLRAVLDLAVDAAEHCREEALVEVMNSFMTKGLTGNEKEKTPDRPPEQDCENWRRSDGLMTWECPLGSMSEGTNCPSVDDDMAGTTIWTCPSDVSSPWAK